MYPSFPSGHRYQIIEDIAEQANANTHKFFESDICCDVEETRNTSQWRAPFRQYLGGENVGSQS